MGLKGNCLIRHFPNKPQRLSYMAKIRILIKISKGSVYDRLYIMFQSHRQNFQIVLLCQHILLLFLP